MHLYRAASRLPQVSRVLKTPSTIPITRNMAFFPRFPSGDFSPLFRLLDDYDVHRSGRGNGSGTSAIRAFQPKFDVREVQEAYELQGELPGINQQDVSIEFVDPHTLVIKGRVERESHRGDDDSQPSAGRITDADQSSSYHKASVEEEGASSESKQDTSGSEDKQVAHADEHAHQNKLKYWVSERSVGEFHRSFTFPTRVDQDAVKASMKNGILNIVVPKAPAPTSKRINIE